VLIIVNLAILILPIGGIITLRLYENELVRSTEAQLISQGVILSAAFKESLTPIIAKYQKENLAGAVEYGIEAKGETEAFLKSDDPYAPIAPVLDLFDDMLHPPAKTALSPGAPANPLAVEAGEKLLPLIQAAKRYNLCGIRVVDFNGVVVASTGAEFGKSLINRKEVRKALEGRYFSLLRQRISDEPMPPLESISRRARVRVFVAIPILDRNRVLGLVVLSRTPIDILKALYQNQANLLIFAISLLIIVILVSIFTSRTIGRPVKRLMKQARTIASGDRKEPAPLQNPGTKEVAELSESFNHMAKTLQERTQYIKTLASSVSHEFKSPLAAIRGAVEILEDHFPEMSTEDRKKFLSMIDSDAGRLERLVGRLLDMVRADVMQTGDQKTEIKPIIDSVAARFKNSGSEVTVEHGQGVHEAKIAPEILESVITTLLDNAGQHGGEEARVRIITSAASNNGDKEVEIFIKDNGVGISQANAAKIFTPFFTTTKDKGGSGLGLSIAQKLIGAHDGALVYLNDSSETVFKITLIAGK